ncbi:VOC family protein [Caenimonas sedimenti]|uniref:VOC family protein n=1 Tax=Caenimonas sedimenti TaxID=2596921 RepID=A0A562ZXU9_9BURK|nr:VOC family protein [Caenimonas sedimenti]
MEAYLNFPGNAEEALKFYARCLGGGVVGDIYRYSAMPPGEMPVPPGWDNKVLHATFESEGARFMASDVPPEQSPPGYSGFAMSVYVPKDKARAQKVFNDLAEGGKVTMPFAPPFWGGSFGMCTDKFGVPWMVSCEVE